MPPFAWGENAVSLRARFYFIGRGFEFAAGANKMNFEPPPPGGEGFNVLANRWFSPFSLLNYYTPSRRAISSRRVKFKVDGEVK